MKNQSNLTLREIWKLNHEARQLQAQARVQDDPKLTVPGMVPSLSAMVKKIQAGMPVPTTARTVETYYKNMELEDIQKVKKQFEELKGNMNEIVRKKNIEAAEKAEQKRLEHENMLKEIEEWKQHKKTVKQAL